MRFSGEFQADVDKSVLTMFDSLPPQAVEEYATVRLFHNTLERFTKGILDDGLKPDDTRATPTEEDLNFARQLFIERGLCYPDTVRLFKTLLEGRKADRDPGVYLYPGLEPSDIPNRGYGIPERIQLLAVEMGYVAAHDTTGPFTKAERDHAKSIYYKYREHILDSDSRVASVAVLEADPFHPVIINNRLNPETIDRILQMDHETALIALRGLGTTIFEGIYIPGSIPPDALKLYKDKIEIQSILPQNVEKLDPTHSRFFNVGSMQRSVDWQPPEW